MSKIFVLTIVILLSSSVYGLFNIKHKVEYLHKDVVELRKQYLNEQKLIHVLHAEWAYLNRPDRLSVLAERHLSAKPLQVTQIFDEKSQDRAIMLSVKHKDQNFVTVGRKIANNRVKWNLQPKNLEFYLPGRTKPLISIKAGN